MRRSNVNLILEYCIGIPLVRCMDRKLNYSNNSFPEWENARPSSSSTGCNRRTRTAICFPPTSNRVQMMTFGVSALSVTARSTLERPELLPFISMHQGETLIGCCSALFFYAVKPAYTECVNSSVAKFFEESPNIEVTACSGKHISHISISHISISHISISHISISHILDIA